MDYTKQLFYSFAEYKKNIYKLNNPDIEALLNGMTKRLEENVADIVVHSDWIDKINNNINYIENAILENRQFIREDGEVLPIEKVKKINKTSVVDLAKHSEYITHLPKEDEDIVPDRIYTVEKETDFSVYENKFLYLLLNTLKGFIDAEESAISDCLEANYTILELDKKNRINDSKNTIKIRFEGKKQIEANGSESLKEAIKSIENISNEVNRLLSMNLMVEMSKYPLISTNITKTNVLKMNENFKACVDLFEYISKYDGEGFDVVLKKNPITLSDDEKLELELAVITLEMLAYKDSNVLSKNYESSYSSYLEDRVKNEEKIRDEKIAELKQKIEQSGKSEIEYILLLENKINDCLEALNEVKVLKHENQVLKEEKDKLNDIIKSKNNNIDELFNKISLLTEESKDKDIKINSLENELTLAKNASKAKDSEVERATNALNSSINANKELNNEISLLKSKISDCERMAEAKEKECNDKIANMEDELVKLRARLLTYNDRSLDDYTTEEGFDELEREYKAIEKIYKEEWKKAKKRIKKELRGE